MQDAFGGLLNIVLVALFLVIVEGVLGFTVNYTKAFKMKNVVISAIEEYEGSHCVITEDSTTVSSDSACQKRIIEGAKQLGYSPSVNINCNKNNGYYNNYNYFCAKETTSAKGGSIYKIVVQVDMNIPIIKNIMGLSFFQVSGDTRVVHKQYEKK